MQTITAILSSIIGLFSMIDRGIKACDHIAEMAELTAGQALNELKLNNAKQLSDLAKELES